MQDIQNRYNVRKCKPIIYCDAVMYLSAIYCQIVNQYTACTESCGGVQ